MDRLGCVFLVATAACGATGPGTGTASLTNVTPMIKSASATSFVGADGGGQMVLGWKLEFTDANPGSNCKSADVHTVASIGIFTNQLASGSAKTATLQTGDIVITTDSPPTVTGTAAATMGAPGVSSIGGTVSISEFRLDNSGTINGTINAGGAASGGGSIALTGSFIAPVCD